MMVPMILPPSGLMNFDITERPIPFCNIVEFQVDGWAAKDVSGWSPSSSTASLSDSYLNILTALANIDPALNEAARNLGAGR